MCQVCYDLDKKIAMMEENPDCTGVIDEPFLTDDELIERLNEECRESGKTQFRIMKEAMINPKERLNWITSIHSQPVEINVRFL